MTLYRPLALPDTCRPDGALPLAGGPVWFDRAEVVEPGRRGPVIAARDIPPEVRDRLTGARPAFAGLTLDRPRLMGILNVTPDSFSDGGRFLDPAAAIAAAEAMGADIVDVGGESTRPGAAEVPAEDEIARVRPVIAALSGHRVSIDTRKAAVAAAALSAGAAIVNDVSALTHDPALAGLVAASGVPVILMHAQGAPATMQDDPRYEDVLTDIFHGLEARIAAAEAAGIPRSRIAVDPGIGFGKTVAHNLTLIRGLTLFHGLGCPVLLGTSRKRFIGTVGGEPVPDRRLPGSLATALAGAAQGAQILRVHDVPETRQALALWAAVREAA
jgi:dihydropteroate synthase